MLTQAQMAQLFDCSTDNIGLHLKNLYDEGEINQYATTEEISVVRQEGNLIPQLQRLHFAAGTRNASAQITSVPRPQYMTMPVSIDMESLTGFGDGMHIY